MHSSLAPGSPSRSHLAACRRCRQRRRPGASEHCRSRRLRTRWPSPASERPAATPSCRSCGQPSRCAPPSSSPPLPAGPLQGQVQHGGMHPAGTLSGRSGGRLPAQLSNKSLRGAFLPRCTQQVQVRATRVQAVQGSAAWPGGSAACCEHAVWSSCIAIFGVVCCQGSRQARAHVISSQPLWCACRQWKRTTGQSPSKKRRRWWPSEACTSSAPSDTSRAASTISCAGAAAGRGPAERAARQPV